MKIDGMKDLIYFLDATELLSRNLDTVLTFSTQGFDLCSQRLLIICTATCLGACFLSVVQR